MVGAVRTGLLAVVCGASCRTPAARPAEPRLDDRPRAVRVVVEVRGEELPDGTSVRVGLLATRANWPGGPSEHRGIGVLREGRAAIVIDAVPQGAWALTGFADLDGNGELDHTLLGMPREPLLFGNDARPRFGPPPFEACLVEVREEPTTIEATLRTR